MLRNADGGGGGGGVSNFPEKVLGRCKGPFKCYVTQMRVGGCQIFQKKVLRL